MKKYLSFILIVFALLGCDKEVSVTPPLGEPENGNVFINSSPSGAKIFLNGKNMGKVTPDSLVYMEFGSGQVTLRLENYFDTSFTVVFAKDKQNKIEIDYYSNLGMRGSISCTSKPISANIFVNDSATGKVTPTKLLNFIPGNYKITYSKNGYRSIDVMTNVKSGTISAPYYELQDTTTWVDYKTSNSGIASNNLSTIEIDNKGKIWIGSFSNGISVYDQTNWEIINTTNSNIPSNVINVIKKDNLGNIWIGTNLGLAKYSLGRWEVFTTTNSSLPNNYIEDIAVSSNNNIWIATKSGLANYVNSGFVVYNSNNTNLPENHITTVGFSLDGKLFAGTSENGIVEFKDSVFVIYALPSVSLPGNSITAIAVDDGNIMWFGHLPTSTNIGGLSLYNYIYFTLITTGLTVNKINNIFIDENNMRWIATDNGIVTFNSQLNKTFITAQNSGLTNNFVQEVEKDNNGYFWIVTDGGGLCKYKK